MYAKLQSLIKAKCLGVYCSEQFWLCAEIISPQPLKVQLTTGLIVPQQLQPIGLAALATSANRFSRYKLAINIAEQKFFQFECSLQQSLNDRELNDYLSLEARSRMNLPTEQLVIDYAPQTNGDQYQVYAIASEQIATILQRFDSTITCCKLLPDCIALEIYESTVKDGDIEVVSAQQSNSTMPDTAIKIAIGLALN